VHWQFSKNFTHMLWYFVLNLLFASTLIFLWNTPYNYAVLSCWTILYCKLTSLDPPKKSEMYNCWCYRLCGFLTVFRFEGGILLHWYEVSKNQAPRGRSLGRNPDKSLKSFPFAIHSHLYSFALRFLFLQTHATSYSFYRSVTLHCKGERMKNLVENHTPFPMA
jgi:hypothetical protein